MRGIFSSLFASKEKTAPKKSEQLEKDLIQIGVSDFSAEKYAVLLASDKADTFSFNATGVAFNNSLIVSTKAYKRLLPELEGKHFNTFELENFYSSQEAILKEPTYTANKIAIKNADLFGSDLENIFKKLSEMKVQELCFDDVSIGSHSDALAAGALNAHVSRMTLKNCGMSDENFTGLSRYIAQSRLEHLDLSKNFPSDKGCAAVITALPATIKSFGIGNASFGHQLGGNIFVKALCERLPQLQKLENLDLAECSLDAKDLKQILPLLPKSVQVLNLKKSETDDESLKILTEYMKKPDVRLYKTFADEIDKPNTLSTSAVEELRTAETANYKKHLTLLQQEKAAEIERTKEGKNICKSLSQASSPKEIKSLLHLALEFGAADELFDRMKKTGTILTVQDLETPGKQGKTFAQACIDGYLAPQLMQPELYGNAKEYQYVYDTLAEQDKRLFDGNAGRPSFQKMKNQVMSNAVKTAVSKKSSAGR